MKKLPRGLKKYIRRQKANLRRTIQDPRVLVVALQELQQQFSRTNDSQKQG